MVTRFIFIHRHSYAAAFNALCTDIWHPPQVKGSRFFTLPIKRMDGAFLLLLFPKYFIFYFIVYPV